MLYRLPLLAAAIIAAVSLDARAAILVQYDLAGAPGNQATTAGSSAAAGVTPLSLSRGSGLNAVAGANSFNSSGWNDLGAFDYIEFGFGTTQAYDADELYVGLRSSGTGPGLVNLSYSVNGSAFTLLRQFDMPDAAFLNVVVDLDSLPDVTSGLVMRFTSANTASSNDSTVLAGGTLRTTGYFVQGVFDRNFQITGTPVTSAAVPAPAALPVFVVALAGLGVALRRQQA